jgi:hypothetical protein
MEILATGGATASAQITLVDLTDDIPIQDTPPEPAKEDMLWMDTSKTPPLLMIYQKIIGDDGIIYYDWVQVSDFAEDPRYNLTVLEKNSSGITILDKMISTEVSQDKAETFTVGEGDDKKTYYYLANKFSNIDQTADKIALKVESMESDIAPDTEERFLVLKNKSSEIDIGCGFDEDDPMTLNNNRRDYSDRIRECTIPVELIPYRETRLRTIFSYDQDGLVIDEVKFYNEYEKDVENAGTMLRYVDGVYDELTPNGVLRRISPAGELLAEEDYYYENDYTNLVKIVPYGKIEFDIVASTKTIISLMRFPLTTGAIIESALSSIEISKNRISQTVNANGVIASINMSANSEESEIQIEASRINLKGYITADMIEVGTITADNISAGAITTEKLASQAITADKIQANTITANEIKAETITAQEIASDAITTEKIQAGAVVADKITAYGLKVNRKSDDKTTFYIDDNGDLTIDADKIQIKSVDAMTSNDLQEVQAQITVEAGKINQVVEKVEKEFTTKLENTIVSVDVYYSASDSQYEAPTDNWYSTPPEKEAGRFVWSRTITTYKDRPPTATDPVCIAGITDQDREPRTITGLKEYYLASAVSEGITNTAPGWSESFPSLNVVNKYLWNCEEISYSRGDSEKTEPRVIGESEEAQVISVISRYLASEANEGITTSSSGWTTAYQIVDESKPYLWHYSEVSLDNGEYQSFAPEIIDVYDIVELELVSIAEWYYLSTSYTEPKDSEVGWTTIMPTWKAGTYIWTKSTITYSDGTVVETAPICDIDTKFIDDLSEMTIEKIAQLEITDEQITASVSSTKKELLETTATIQEQLNGDIALAKEELIEQITTTKNSVLELTDEKITSTVSEINTNIEGQVDIINSTIEQTKEDWTATFEAGYGNDGKGIVQMNREGITVQHTKAKSMTSMTADGIKITNTSSNEPIFYVNSNGKLYIKGDITVESGSVSTDALDSALINKINTASSNASSALSTADAVDTKLDSLTYTKSGKTYIDGGALYSDTVNANVIQAGSTLLGPIIRSNLGDRGIEMYYGRLGFFPDVSSSKWSDSKRSGYIGFDSNGKESTGDSPTRFLIESTGTYVLKMISAGDMSLRAGAVTSTSGLEFGNKKIYLMSDVHIAGNLTVVGSGGLTAVFG